VEALALATIQGGKQQELAELCASERVSLVLIRPCRWHCLMQRLENKVRRVKVPFIGLVEWILAWHWRRQSRHYSRRLRRAARGFDVVYCFWPHLQVLPRLSRPLVITVQDLNFFEFPEIIGARWTRHEWRNLNGWLAAATQVAVSSQHSRALLVSHFGADWKAVPVIGHAIKPLVHKMAGEANAPIKRTLPEKYFIYPANVSVHKNHYNLLLAWARFSRRREFPLVCIGFGTEWLALPWPDCPDHDWPLLRLCGMLRRVRLKAGEDYHALGFVPDDQVAPLLAGATALIMPSLAEGGGSFPVEEALTAGVPVLCADIPVLREHLQQRSAQVAWFDPQSPEAIVRALNHFLENLEMYRQSAQAGRHDPRPSWSDVAAKYVDLFSAAIAKHERENPHTRRARKRRKA
jgi:glycosyltransferase involved in cell wall biosynthesis